MFNCLELWLSIADLSYSPGREGGARDLPAPHFSPIYKISRRIEVVLSKNLCRSRQPNRFVEKVFWWKILVISQDVLAPSRRPWEKLFPLKRKRGVGIAPSVFTNLSRNIQTMLVRGSECPYCTKATNHSAYPGRQVQVLVREPWKKVRSITFFLEFSLNYSSLQPFHPHFLCPLFEIKILYLPGCIFFQT